MSTHVLNLPAGASALWQNRLGLLLESTGEGVFGIDLAGNCVFINRAGAQMLGFAADEVMGRNMHALTHHSHPDGSPYADSLQATYQARPRAYPSSVHAAYAFMSGECEVLAEDEAVLQRLLAREEWRFYRRLPIDIVPDARQPQIVLAQADPVSARYVDQAVRYWKASGALRQARAQRVGQVNLEVTALQDGLVCHS